MAVRNGVVDATPILDIGSDVATEGSRGLLSIAFAPNSSLFTYSGPTTAVLFASPSSHSATAVWSTCTPNETSSPSPTPIPTPTTEDNSLSGPTVHLYIGTGDGGGT